MILNRNIAKNCYYYDVNSLYPYAMKNIMPGTYLNYISNINTDIFINPWLHRSSPKNLFDFFIAA